MVSVIGYGYLYYKDTEKRKVEREAFVQSQINKGLISFVDRKGIEKWGSSEEVAKWSSEDNIAKIKELKLYQVIESIEQFEPSRIYHNEFGYHVELQGWLKKEFPNTSFEKTTGASRPDIVIDDIAIEVKGPTYTKDLKTLSDKCVRYSNYYNNLILVLFEPSFSEELFLEMATGIERVFPHVKIIRKD